jgi:hypothetical protein
MRYEVYRVGSQEWTMPECPAQINEEIWRHLDEQHDAMRASGVSDAGAALARAGSCRTDQRATVEHAVPLRRGFALFDQDAAQVAFMFGARRSDAFPRHRREHRDFSILNAVVLRPLPCEVAAYSLVATP